MQAQASHAKLANETRTWGVRLLEKACGTQGVGEPRIQYQLSSDTAGEHVGASPPPFLIGFPEGRGDPQRQRFCGFVPKQPFGAAPFHGSPGIRRLASAFRIRRFWVSKQPRTGAKTRPKRRVAKQPAFLVWNRGFWVSKQLQTGATPAQKVGCEATCLFWSGFATVSGRLEAQNRLFFRPRSMQKPSNKQPPL